MHYEKICKGSFLARPNRFIAHVELEGEPVVCHVKNTGRCRELLVPGAAVYLQEFDGAARKTKFDLIAVEKAGFGLINMDAQAPNKVFAEWARSGAFLPGLTLLRPETTWGNSRFDFYFEAGERRGFVEVKGVTLEEGGAVLFPDAPTERGVKHVEELIACRAAGYEAFLCFVIQMERVDHFSPNDRTHPAFGDALRRAAASGVHLLAYDCQVTPESLKLRQPVEIRL
ncbi:MAG TPA: DNA/RNA nuclease SfsA [Pseudoflavonifractor sp.]|nr:DNA/RNA nuclease SfsA [Pseudoflavonifractor sp.]